MQLTSSAGAARHFSVTYYDTHYGRHTSVCEKDAGPSPALCEVADPVPGTWSIQVANTAQTTNPFTLLFETGLGQNCGTSATPLRLTPGTPLTGAFASTAGGTCYYALTMPPAQQRATMQLTSSAGAARHFSVTYYDSHYGRHTSVCDRYAGQVPAECEVADPVPGEWQVQVQNSGQTTDPFTLLISIGRGQNCGTSNAPLSLALGTPLTGAFASVAGGTCYYELQMPDSQQRATMQLTADAGVTRRIFVTRYDSYYGTQTYCDRNAGPAPARCEVADPRPGTWQFQVQNNGQATDAFTLLITTGRGLNCGTNAAPKTIGLAAPLRATLAANATGTCHATVDVPSGSGLATFEVSSMDGVLRHLSVTTYDRYYGTTPHCDRSTVAVLRCVVTNPPQGTYSIEITNTGAAAGSFALSVRTDDAAPLPPNALRAERMPDGRVNLSWEDGAGPGERVTEYKLYRYVAGSEDVLAARLPAGTTSYVDGDATLGPEYRFSLAAMNGSAEGVRSLEATVPADAPNLTGTAGNGYVTLAWTAPAGGSNITGYRVYRGTTSGGETPLTRGGCSQLADVLSCTDAGLTNGQTYHYRVSALNATGEGAPSAALALVPATVPREPIMLAATPGNGKLTLAWMAPTSNGGSTITGYKVYLGTASGGETLLTSGGCGALGNVRNCTHGGLANGQRYYYRVSAVNAVGEGSPFGEANATPRSVPGAPMGLSVRANDSRVVLSWNAPADNGGSPVTGYRAYRGTSSGQNVFLAAGGCSLLGTALSCTDAGLTNGQAYQFRVSAVNAAGNGPLSAEVGATPATVPDAPAGLSAAGGPGHVNLTWTAPSWNGGAAVAGYKVYRGASSGGETLLTAGGCGELGAVLRCTDAGLGDGKTYHYKVAAVNAMGEGPFSTGTGVTTEIIVPGAPLNLTATAGDGRVTLEWAQPGFDGGASVLGYLIYRGGAGGAESLLSSGGCAGLGAVLACADVGLVNGQTYHYRVSAVNSVGEGLQTPSVRATPATRPDIPANLTAAVADGHVALAWSAPASDGGATILAYRVYRGPTGGAEENLTGGGCGRLGNVLACTDVGLVNGQTYHYRVSAVNSVGEGVLSQGIRATPATVPGPPASLSAVSGRAQVILSWLAPPADGGAAVTGYRVYRDAAEGGEALVTSGGCGGLSGVLTCTDVGLTNGQTYRYRIAASNAVGAGALSSAVSVTPRTVPHAPASMVANAGPGEVLLKWSPPPSDGGSPITGFQVYRGTHPGDLVPYERAPPAGLSLGDRQVIAGVTYYYAVEAINEVGEGVRSGVASAKPHDSIGYAIVFVGGARGGGGQASYENEGRFAYQALRTLHFPPERILYLSTREGDGVDAEASKTALMNGLLDWAAARVGPNEPLLVFLVDHGAFERFYTGSEAVTAAELDGWLDRVEERTEPERITVVIECSYSGSFIPKLSDPERIVVTSTDAEHTSYSLPGINVAFSHEFFQSLKQRESLRNAFEAGAILAKLNAQRVGLQQTALLDDNGDGKGSAFRPDMADGSRAASVFVGLGSNAIQSLRPGLANVAIPGAVGNGTPIAISAEVHVSSLGSPITRVVAYVVPPQVEGAPAPNAPYVELAQTGAGRYEGAFAATNRPGIYRVAIVVEDEAGNTVTSEDVEVRVGDLQEHEAPFPGLAVSLAAWVLALVTARVFHRRRGV